MSARAVQTAEAQHAGVRLADKDLFKPVVFFPTGYKELDIDRNGVVDPIDFIEQIPFDETRNYVERVLENAEVYRDRLAGKDVPVQILGDLYAPNPPPSATGP